MICNMRGVIQSVQVIGIIYARLRPRLTIHHLPRQPRVLGQSGGVILLNAMLNRYCSCREPFHRQSERHNIERGVHTYVFVERSYMHVVSRVVLTS